jgi:hypothetical protein
MAVGVVMDFDDATLEQYDQVMEKMQLASSGSEMPAGGLFHWVTKTDTGLRVTDVWENREEFDRFAAEQIGPFTQEVGITAEPRVSFYDVHNYMER